MTTLLMDTVNAMGFLFIPGFLALLTMLFGCNRAGYVETAPGSNRHPKRLQHKKLLPF